MSLVPVLQQEAPVPLACLLPRARTRDRPPSSAARLLHDLSEGRAQQVLTPAGRRDALGVKDQQPSVKRNLGRGVCEAQHSGPCRTHTRARVCSGTSHCVTLVFPQATQERLPLEDSGLGLPGGEILAPGWWPGPPEGGTGQPCPFLWLAAVGAAEAGKPAAPGSRGKQIPRCTASPRRRKWVQALLPPEVWDALSESV